MNLFALKAAWYNADPVDKLWLIYAFPLQILCSWVLHTHPELDVLLIGSVVMPNVVMIGNVLGGIMFTRNLERERYKLDVYRYVGEKTNTSLDIERLARAVYDEPSQ